MRKGTSRSGVVQPLHVLLRRRLLHPRTRRDPSALSQLWKRIAPGYERLVEIWEEIDLPGTFEKPTRREQEEAFVERLAWARKRLQEKSGPPWATEVVEKMVEARRGTSSKAFARVVFAIGREDTPSCMRPGCVVDFELLAKPATGELPLTDPHIFDDLFRDALEYDLKYRLEPAAHRWLRHDWGFLVGREGQSSVPVLGKTSGTFGIWMSMWLTGAGSYLHGERWAMEPWVIVSATLREDGPAPGGCMGPVTLLTEKAEVLLEEGFRALLVEDPHVQGALPADEYLIQLARREGKQPFQLGTGAEDLLVIPFQKGTKKEIFDRLRPQGFFHTVELAEVENRSLLREPNSAVVWDRNEAQVLPILRFCEEAEYLTPSHVLESLEKARQRLPDNKGYLHLVGPGGIGKSMLIRAMQRGVHTDAATLRYAVLRGEPESPGAFCDTVWNDAADQARKYCDARTGQLLAREIGRSNPVNESADVKVKEYLRQKIRDLLDRVKRGICRDRHLMLAIDGVNEMDTTASQDVISILDLLPESQSLPAGCYILLTSRGDNHLPEAVLERIRQCAGDHYQVAELDPLSDVHQSLLEEYLNRHLVDEDGSLKRRILEEADGSFLYVRFYRDLVRLRRESTDGQLGDLPAGNSVFPAYLEALAECVGAASFRNRHQRILALVSAAYRPVTWEQLRCWLGIEPNSGESDDLDLALQQLQTLIRRDDCRNNNGVPTYEIGHADLGDWLLKTAWPGWIGKAIQTAHNKIGQHGLRLLRNGDEEPIDEYHHLYTPSHLIDAGEREHAEDALRVAMDREHRRSLSAKTLGLRQAVFVPELRVAQVGRLVEIHGGLREAGDKSRNLLLLKLRANRALLQAIMWSQLAHTRTEECYELSRENVRIVEMVFGSPNDLSASTASLLFHVYLEYLSDCLAVGKDEEADECSSFAMQFVSVVVNEGEERQDRALTLIGVDAAGKLLKLKAFAVGTPGKLEDVAYGKPRFEYGFLGSATKSYEVIWYCTCAIEVLFCRLFEDDISDMRDAIGPILLNASNGLTAETVQYYSENEVIGCSVDAALVTPNMKENVIELIVADMSRGGNSGMQIVRCLFQRSEAQSSLGKSKGAAVSLHVCVDLERAIIMACADQLGKIEELAKSRPFMLVHFCYHLLHLATSLKIAGRPEEEVLQPIDECIQLAGHSGPVFGTSNAAAARHLRNRTDWISRARFSRRRSR